MSLFEKITELAEVTPGRTFQAGEFQRACDAIIKLEATGDTEALEMLGLLLVELTNHEELFDIGHELRKFWA